MGKEQQLSWLAMFVCVAARADLYPEIPFDQWRLVTEKIVEDRRKTVSCYFIQVNYLSLLSYIQWKLSNKTMTYKTSLKNMLLNGKRLLTLGPWERSREAVDFRTSGPWDVQWADVQDKNISMCTPSRFQSPVTCVAGICSNPCATAAINKWSIILHDSTGHHSHHSSQSPKTTVLLLCIVSRSCR